MRRVDCARCGVHVEMVPWATGKSPMTHAFVWFLANWTRLLSLEGDGTSVSRDLGRVF
ncbi:MAG: hypothetical protein JNL21_35555 [Myxococcales bacterium]|nr:hypothetical protein [Myxococcales bacterium]